MISAALCTGTVQYSTALYPSRPVRTVQFTALLYCTVYVGVRVYNALYSTSDAMVELNFSANYCSFL